MKNKEIIIDSFAGGGGASTGIRWALGRDVDVAINHDGDAIAMHEANHPKTKHFKEDVWKISPRKITKGRPVGLLWASPDCKHFSRAKGSKPVAKNIRSLAWVIVRWAHQCKPRIIIMENVREFEDWGPLLPIQECRACQWRGTEGQAILGRRGGRRCPQCDSTRLKVTEERVPDPDKKGITFRQFVGRLKALGYKVQWKTLNAADYGAPTHRRRLFLVARCDGAPIEWPAPTHGDPKKIGDDLFGAALKPWRTAAECIDWDIPCPSIFDRKKPLADATMRRIALGVKRYVLDNAKPFIVYLAHGGHDNRSCPINEPLHTVQAGGKSHAIVTPLMIPLTHSGDRRVHQPSEPLPTITTAHRGELGLIVPSIVSLAHGDGGTFGNSRGRSVESPLGTIHAGGGNHALVSAFLAKHFGGQVGVSADAPLPTTVRGTQNQIVAANLISLRNHVNPSGCDTPTQTVTASGTHMALVYSFMVKYFGTAIGQEVDAPLHTATSKSRFGLVTVDIDGQTYAIVDIGMRMLTPRELARAQGFPDSYVLTGTKTSQVARIGNSVSPYPAEAVVAANLCLSVV